MSSTFQEALQLRTFLRSGRRIRTTSQKATVIAMLHHPRLLTLILYPWYHSTTSSSFVGMASTLTLESSVLITASFLGHYSSESILMPRNSIFYKPFLWPSTIFSNSSSKYKRIYTAHSATRQHTNAVIEHGFSKLCPFISSPLLLLCPEDRCLFLKCQEGRFCSEYIIAFVNIFL